MCDGLGWGVVSEVCWGVVGLGCDKVRCCAMWCDGVRCCGIGWGNGWLCVAW